MEVEKYSSTLEPFVGDVANGSLAESLKTIFEKYGADIQPLAWDDHNIAVPLILSIDIPPLGNKDNIEIYANEPVLLVFSLSQYPDSAPQVFTDRMNFPKDRLAHLYIAKLGRPPAFCYTRENRDDWYSNKRILDLITRIENWLRDAASGELSLDGDQFDPVRLEGYKGLVIYDYDRIAKLVKDDVTLLPNHHLAVGLFESHPNGGFRLVKLLSEHNLKTIEQDLITDKAKREDDPNRKRYRFGYFLWASSSAIFDNYNVDMPRNWAEFKSFCNGYGLNYSLIEEVYLNIDTSGFVMFPVVLAISRPRKITGYSSNIEFLNFCFSVDSKEIVNGSFVDSVEVALSSHNQPLTIEKAKQISGVNSDSIFSAAIFGCGALGSKVTMHLARNGITSLMLIDPDEFSTHNLVRHTLLPEYEGQNKASALAGVIERMYPDNDIQIEHSPFPILPFAIGSAYFVGMQWVLDFTASEAFFLRAITTDAFNGLNVARGHITDFGNLGILSREGINRNPRLDDLRIALYSYYDSIPEVKSWLAREHDSASKTNITVSIGVGCNSETTVLPDEKVSLHAAAIMGALKKDIGSDRRNGKILLTQIRDDEEFQVKTIPIEVRPLDIFRAINDAAWSVRFANGIVQGIQQAAKKAGRNETGGVFTGVVNHKTKTIHITGLISAPPDSRGNPICFVRGVQGLPDKVFDVYDGSGGQLGYVGEWHSHPKGPHGLSEIDMDTIRKFKSEFKSLPTPLPVFLTIVLPDMILPFVY